MNRIPSNAFEQYVALGESRSYQALATRFGVAKRSIVKRATLDRWQARLARVENTAREKSDRKLAESIAQMNDRHLRLWQAVQKRALETLTSLPLATAMDAVRSLEIAARNERLIRGEPNDRQVLSVEETIRREYIQLLEVVPAGTAEVARVDRG